MRRVLHLSDLHFGRLHPPAMDSLRQFLLRQEENLDLIVVTGDWTQRARSHQFKEAALFLAGVKLPVLTVPGNHDVPLYNLWDRFTRPFYKYNLHIGSITKDVYVDEFLAVVGISTVNVYTPVEGKAHARELERAQQVFSAQEGHVLRILAGHHPLPVHEFDQVQADLILTGHCHASNIEWIKHGNGRDVLHISAGTSVSSRTRHEVNSFHILNVEKNDLLIETFDLGDDGFMKRQDTCKFPRAGN